MYIIVIALTFSFFIFSSELRDDYRISEADSLFSELSAYSAKLLFIINLIL
jgi:hypothetical protein